MNKSKRVDYLIVATLSFIIINIFYALTGVYPYSEFALDFSDLRSSYIPQILELKRIVISGNFTELLHSWNRIDGSTPLAMANLGILLNPLTLLYFLVPLSKVSEITILYITLKYILSSISFLFMLRYLFPSRTGRRNQIALSIAWAFNAFVVTFQFLIIWTDFIILLPLVICTLYKFSTSKGKCIVSTSLLLVYIYLANFYMAYITVIYSFLFLIIIFKPDLKTVGKYILCHMLALIISLPILYPSFKIILSTKSYTAHYSFGLVYSFTLFVTKLMTGYFNDILYENSIYIFIGATASILLTQIFKIKPLKRDCILLLIMLISCLFEPFYSFWHAFDTPDGFPCRMSFCLIFTVIFIIYRYYNEINYKISYKVFIAFALIIIFSVYKTSGKLILLYIPLCTLMCAYLLYSNLQYTSVPLLISFEIILTSLSLFNTNYAENGLPTVHSQSVDRLNLAKQLPLEDTSFYRVHLKDIHTYDLNWGNIYNVKTITGFNNISNKSFRNVTDALHGGTIVGNSILINDLTPVSSLLLGVKYELPYTQIQDEAYLGFITKEPISKEDIKNKRNACINQNNVITKMTGLDLPVFEHVLTDDKGFDSIKGETYYVYSDRTLLASDLVLKVADKEYTANTVGLIEVKGTGGHIDCSMSEGDLAITVYKLNTQHYQKHRDILLKQSLKVTNYSISSLQAEVNVLEDDSLLYISLPTGNYRVYENGVELKTTSYIPGYLGVRLNKGFHQIFIKYSYF